MTDLTAIKCKNCGADLNIAGAVNGTVECEYCGSVFTLPKEGSSPAVLQTLRIAEHDLDVCAFDKAYEGYRKAAMLDESEPEAYFGMSLSEFGVQYLKDTVKHRLQPICHKVTQKKFSQNENYLRAISLATAEQKIEYARRAEEIDYISAEFYKLQAQGLKYDCFLCVKVTDDSTGMRTSDYKYADDLYFLLRGKGYAPFFSERELKNVTGADYEARILYALKTAECMIVVCGNESYLQTPWVKNEYTRFLKLINDDEKESDSITLAFFGAPIERLPNKNGKIQGINLNAIDASERVTAFVENHTPAARARRAAEEAKKRTAEEELLRSVEEQKRSQRELEEKIQQMRAQVPAAQSGTGTSVANLLVRAKQELDFGDFETAAKYYRQVVDFDPQNAEGWFGAFLCDMEAKDENEILKHIKLEDISDIKKNKNYVLALKNASGHFKERADSFNQALEVGERTERERREEEERRRKEAEWDRVNNPSVDNYNRNEFEIAKKEGKWTLEKYKGNGADVKIPRGVEVIGGGAFSGCSGLTSVTIPDSVTFIGGGAFSDCEGLTTVTIPGSVTSIGDCAFGGCTSLTDITIPNSVTTIDNCAFCRCGGLTTVTIPNSVTSIGDYAFGHCKGLTAVMIPNSVTSIGDYAFENCTSLTEITIPNSVTSIGNDAFRNCTSLTEITIPNSVTSIGEWVFSGCFGLTSVIISDGVTSIGRYAFSYCKGLTTVTISNSVTSISEWAFGFCSGLTSVTMPLRFKKLRKKIFKGCKHIKFTYTE